MSSGNAFSFELNEVAQTVDRLHDALVNLSVVFCHPYVATNSFGESGEFFGWVFSFVGSALSKEIRSSSASFVAVIFIDSCNLIF
jgi:hypothetical protein